LSTAVVQVDLRGRDAGNALTQAYAMLADPAYPDLTRLVVLDGAGYLARHSRAFEVLLTSRRLDQVLCIIVGRPNGPFDGLELPGSVGAAQGAGVLWIPDTTGVDWRVAASAAATRREETRRADLGLRRLMDVLGYPEVFDRVRELAAQVPGGVSNPGMWLAGVGGSQSEFLVALAGAIDRILELSPSSLPAAETLSALRDTAVVGPAAIVQGSPLAQVRDRLRQDVTAARESAGRFAQARSLLSPSPRTAELIGIVGAELAGLVDRLGALFEGAHSTADLSSAQRQRIRDEGMALPVATAPDRAKLREVISAHVRTRLADEMSLPDLSQSLRALEKELSPDGSRSRVAELNRVCSPDLIRRLRTPAPFSAPEGVLTWVGGAVGLLASLHPAVGLFTGLAMAALWVGLLALTVVRGPSGRISAQGLPLAVNAGATTLGVAVGVLIGKGSPPAPVWVGGLVAAGLVAGLAIDKSWRTRARQWIEASGIEEAPAAAEGLVTLAIETASEEWAQVASRIDIVEPVIRARAAVDGVADRLAAYVTALKADLESAPLHPGSLGELAVPVRAYLRGLIIAALRPRWRELSSDPPMAHEQLAQLETANLLADWERHVEEHGLVGQPPFADDHGFAAQEAVSLELDEITRAATRGAFDVMWQLCAAPDLSLLDTDGQRLQTVRFAPRAGRAQVAARLPADTVWISSARHAGVVRLVPLRPGLVMLTWSEEDKDGSGGRMNGVGGAYGTEGAQGEEGTRR
jgi:hypothetical protein